MRKPQPNKNLLEAVDRADAPAFLVRIAECR